MPEDCDQFHYEAELVQVQYLDGLIEWLERENQTSSSTLHGAVDTARIAGAGHSRGAKLACLHFAGAIRQLTCDLGIDKLLSCVESGCPTPDWHTSAAQFTALIAPKCSISLYCGVSKCFGMQGT